MKTTHMPAQHSRAGRVLLGESDPSELARHVEELSRLGYECIGVGTASEIKQALLRGPVDVIVSELYFPDDQQMEFLDGLRPTLERGTSLVLATGRPSLRTAVRAIRLGAVDYLFKPVEPADLRGAVEKAVRRAWLLQRMAALGALADNAWSALSERERQVVRSLYAGQSPRQIADSLSISQYTVRNHLRSIYSKLGVHSQRELLSLGAPAAPMDRS